MDYRHRAELLRVAREALYRAVRGEPDADHADDIPRDLQFRPEFGAFVSLHRRNGAIRGCVGCMQSEKALPDTVAEMACAAALRDPRFSPVRADELGDIVVEVSVLSPTVPLESLDDLVIGRDGLLAVGRGRRGVLLPQVAIERGWDVSTFAEQTCMKANLDPGAWRDGDVRLYRFAAEVFSESLPPDPTVPS